MFDLHCLTTKEEDVKRLLVLLLVVTGVVSAAALATPGSGVVAELVARGSVDPADKMALLHAVSRHRSGPWTIVDQNITIQPGGHTGWHTHPGPVLVVVKSGSLTLYGGTSPSTCPSETFTAGQAFVDPGGGFVHIARNEGTEPTQLSVTYIVPGAADAPFRIDAPQPAACSIP